MCCGILREFYWLCRFMDVWAAFIAMEVAEQNLDAARSIYKRCYSYKLEDGGQVRGQQSHALPEESVPRRSRRQMRLCCAWDAPACRPTRAAQSCL